MKNHNQVWFTIFTELLCAFSICIAFLLFSDITGNVLTIIIWIIGQMTLQNKVFKFLSWNFDISNDAIVWDDENQLFVNGMDLKELS